MCPCEDPACGDVRAHDVQARLQLQINVPALLAGVLGGSAARGD